MRQIRRAICLAVVSGAAAAFAGAAEQPKPLPHFPSSAWNFRALLDGSVICTGSSEDGRQRVFRSQGDARRWTELPLDVGDPARYSNLKPVGGDRHRLFFAATQHDGGWCLLRVSLDGEAVVLRKVPSRVVAFASPEVGAVAVEFSVLLTHDGGKSWNHGARLQESEDVCALLWVTESRLLVGGSNGSVQLYERLDDKGLRRVWEVTLARSSLYALALDGQHVWARAAVIHRLALANGHEDAKIDPGVSVAGFAPCHGRLLIWHEVAGKTPDGQLDIKPAVSVWRPNAGAQGYEREASIEMPLRDGFSPVFVAAIFPDQAPRCLVFSKDGDAFALDLDKRTVAATDLRVTLPRQSPPGALAGEPDEETMRLIKNIVSLGKQVTPAERDLVVREADKKTGLSRRERAEWIANELQRIIDAKKAEKPEK